MFPFHFDRMELMTSGKYNDFGYLYFNSYINKIIICTKYDYMQVVIIVLMVNVSLNDCLPH